MINYGKFSWELDYQVSKDILEAETVRTYDLSQEFEFHIPITKANDIPTLDELIEQTSKDKFIIEGYANTPELDRQNDIIEPKAFKAALEGFKLNPILYYQHREPAGKVLKWKVDDGGFWISAYISRAAQYVRILIAEGILRTFSIGGRILAAEEKKLRNGDIIRLVTKLELFEVSVVGIPANRRSTFDLVRSLKTGTDLEDVKLCTNCKDKFVERIEELEKKVEEDIKGGELDLILEVKELSEKEKKELEAKDAEVKEEKKDEVKDTNISFDMDALKEAVVSTVTEAIKPIVEKVDALEQLIEEKSKPKDRETKVIEDKETKVLTPSDVATGVLSIVKKYKDGVPLTPVESRALDAVVRQDYEKLDTALFDKGDFVELKS